MAASKTIRSILKNSVKAPMPKDIIPMALKLTHSPFDHKDWQYEIKWDGFRLISYLEAHKAELRSRKNISLNKRFEPIKQALESFSIDAVFDGEAVLLNDDGCADFSGLMSGKDGCLVYYVFDLLWYNGYNLMDMPLYQRKEMLKEVLPPSEIIRYNDHVHSRGVDLFNLVKERNIEGIVAKHRYSTYSAGYRTNQWLKIKTEQRVNGIVAGILLDKDKHGSGFQSLIIGVQNSDRFKYIGTVEAGITKTSLTKILSNAKASHTSIFSPVPKINAKMPFRDKIKNPEIIWLNPDIRCEVKYLELDNYGLMRHAAFKGVIGL
jgi:bifunctional non-homologous end joining protein LigD